MRLALTTFIFIFLPLCPIYKHTSYTHSRTPHTLVDFALVDDLLLGKFSRQSVSANFDYGGYGWEKLTRKYLCRRARYSTPHTDFKIRNFPLRLRFSDRNRGKFRVFHVKINEKRLIGSQFSDFSTHFHGPHAFHARKTRNFHFRPNLFHLWLTHRVRSLQ